MLFTHSKFFGNYRIHLKHRAAFFGPTLLSLSLALLFEMEITAGDINSFKTELNCAMKPKMSETNDVRRLIIISKFCFSFFFFHSIDFSHNRKTNRLGVSNSYLMRSHLNSCQKVTVY